MRASRVRDLTLDVRLSIAGALPELHARYQGLLDSGQAYLELAGIG